MHAAFFLAGEQQLHGARKYDLQLLLCVVNENEELFALSSAAADFYAVRQRAKRGRDPRGSRR